MGKFDRAGFEKLQQESKDDQEGKENIKKFIDKAHGEALYINSENPDEYLEVFKNDLEYKGENRNSWTLSAETLKTALDNPDKERREKIIDFVIRHHPSEWLLERGFAFNDSALTGAAVEKIKAQIENGTWKGNLHKIDKTNDTRGIVADLINMCPGPEQGEFGKVKNKEIAEWTAGEIDKFGVDYILSKYNNELFEQLYPYFTKKNERFADIRRGETGYYTAMEIKGAIGEFEINFRKKNTTYTDGFSPRRESSDKTSYGQSVLFINGFKINTQDTKRFQRAIRDWGGDPYRDEWPLSGDLK